MTLTVYCSNILYCIYRVYIPIWTNLCTQYSKQIISDIKKRNETEWIMIFEYFSNGIDLWALSALSIVSHTVSHYTQRVHVCVGRWTGQHFKDFVWDYSTVFVFVFVLDHQTCWKCQKWLYFKYLPIISEVTSASFSIQVVWLFGRLIWITLALSSCHNKCSMYVMLLLTFHVNTFRAGSVNSESAEPVDNQLHDTSYPGSPMLGSVKPGSS